MMLVGEGPASEGGMNDPSSSSGADPTAPVDEVGWTGENEDDATSAEHPLNQRQCCLQDCVEDLVETLGQFEQDAGPNGAHYMAESPFSSQGIACQNCVFYDGARSCEAVRGDIDPAGVCKLWIIPADLVTRSKMPESVNRSAAPVIVRTWDTAQTEIRSSADGGDVMVGHFAVFNKWTEINSRFEGQFMERIAPTAFDDTLAKRAKQIRVLYDHGADPQIGNKPLGEPQVMRAEGAGVYYEVKLFDASYVNDLKPALRAGQLGASFRMKVTADEWNNPTRSSNDNPQMLPERTITGIELYEFGPVTFPAYAEATAGLRSRTDWFVDELLSDPAFIARYVERAGPKVVQQLIDSVRADGGLTKQDNTGKRADGGETVRNINRYQLWAKAKSITA